MADEEYLDLFFADASSSGDGLFEWQLNQPYYSSDRSRACYVAVVMVGISGVTTNTTPIFICWDNPLMNTYSSSSIGACLACVNYYAGAGNSYNYISNSDTYYSVGARPNIIRLSIRRTNTNVIGTADTAAIAGCIKLKFVYKNADEEIDAFNNTRYAS